ncbi:protein FAM185A isoform X1 [Echeneis naucrates]|uniref:protein FAM185A isoform X1 n=1 Tax=Echeneis naucrates TaxID=173247 RepID=UPI0011135E95|nr:protein FAM185A isoform X1 [Echeneis naucrates]
MAASLFLGVAGQRGCVGLLRCLAFSPGILVPPRGPRLTPRSFSGSPAEGRAALRRWDLPVSPFSTVRAQLTCSISVRSLDPHSFPEADRAFIAVHGGDSEQQQVCLDQLRVHYDDQTEELLISAENLKSSVSIELTAPIKSNLFITTMGEGHVTVKKMECDICKVQTERGNCLLHSVKGHQVTVQSSGGHITCDGTIHGNVDISASGDSAVELKKLQGTKMSISTEHGPLKAKAIYAESSCISSCSGTIQLGHMHGNGTVRNVFGDTVIDGSNSFLNVSSRSGVIDVYVGDSAELHSQEGAVSVRVPSTLTAGVELCGAMVEISPEVVLHRVENNTTQGQTTVTGYMNSASPVDQWVKAQADKGCVTLKTQSWFESLKLGS